MDLGTTLGVVLTMGLFGLAILIVLWPGEKSARRLLGKWAIQDPSDAEVAAAGQYLRRRPVLVPVASSRSRPPVPIRLRC